MELITSQPYHLRLVWSDNGVDFKEDPGYSSLLERNTESYGIEDCVSKIEDTYHLTYTMVLQMVLCWT
jgi:predicted GH43/DUF377 family glycosyl hydrolase